jgi:hypothetical protein
MPALTTMWRHHHRWHRDRDDYQDRYGFGDIDIDQDEYSGGHGPNGRWAYDYMISGYRSRRRGY